jgi:hypothetical protein
MVSHAIAAGTPDWRGRRTAAGRLSRNLSKKPLAGSTAIIGLHWAEVARVAGAIASPPRPQIHIRRADEYRGSGDR